MCMVPSRYPKDQIHKSLPKVIMTDQFSVKWKLGDQLRRFSVTPNEGESKFSALNRHMSAIVAGAHIPEITYEDDENDVITIGSDAELIEAIKHFDENCVSYLRLNSPAVVAATPAEVNSSSSGQNEPVAIPANVAVVTPTEVVQPDAPQTPRQSETDNPRTGAVHANVLCDCCDMVVVGHRFRCIMCADYDLCQQCESTGLHGHHAMLRIVDPEATMVPWGARLRSNYGMRRNPYSRHRHNHSNNPSSPFSFPLLERVSQMAAGANTNTNGGNNTASGSAPTASGAHREQMKDSLKRGFELLSSYGQAVTNVLSNMGIEATSEVQMDGVTISDTRQQTPAAPAATSTPTAPAAPTSSPADTGSLTPSAQAQVTGVSPDTTTQRSQQTDEDQLLMQQLENFMVSNSTQQTLEPTRAAPPTAVAPKEQIEKELQKQQKVKEMPDRDQEKIEKLRKEAEIVNQKMRELRLAEETFRADSQNQGAAKQTTKNMKTPYDGLFAEAERERYHKMNEMQDRLNRQERERSKRVVPTPVYGRPRNATTDSETATSRKPNERAECGRNRSKGTEDGKQEKPPRSSRLTHDDFWGRGSGSGAGADCFGGGIWSSRSGFGGPASGFGDRGSFYNDSRDRGFGCGRDSFRASSFADRSGFETFGGRGGRSPVRDSAFGGPTPARRDTDCGGFGESAGSGFGCGNGPSRGGFGGRGSGRFGFGDYGGPSRFQDSRRSERSHRDRIPSNFMPMPFDGSDLKTSEVDTSYDYTSPYRFSTVDSEEDDVDVYPYGRFGSPWSNARDTWGSDARRSTAAPTGESRREREVRELEEKHRQRTRTASGGKVSKDSTKKKTTASGTKTEEKKEKERDGHAAERRKRTADESIKSSSSRQIPRACGGQEFIASEDGVIYHNNELYKQRADYMRFIDMEMEKKRAEAASEQVNKEAAKKNATEPEQQQKSTPSASTTATASIRRDPASALGMQLLDEMIDLVHASSTALQPLYPQAAPSAPKESSQEQQPEVQPEAVQSNVVVIAPMPAEVSLPEETEPVVADDVPDRTRHESVGSDVIAVDSDGWEDASAALVDEYLSGTSVTGVNPMGYSLPLDASHLIPQSIYPPLDPFSQSFSSSDMPDPSVVRKQEIIGQLLVMGFTEPQAKRAIAHCGSDLENCIDYLTNASD